MRAAICARVSTLDQEPENQLQELRRYVEARGWSATCCSTAVRMLHCLTAGPLTTS
jgi:DNA invertase Pin-like site-specific DNA recombinase